MTATRVTGVMAVPGLALIAWRAAGADRRSQSMALASVAGVAGRHRRLQRVQYAVSGDPFAWYDAITFWGYRPGGNPFGGVFGLLQALRHAAVSVPRHRTDGAVRHAQRSGRARRARARAADLAALQCRLCADRARGVCCCRCRRASSKGWAATARCSFPIALALASLERRGPALVLLGASAVLYAIGLALFVTVHPLF